jgi:hypothetical protein
MAISFGVLGCPCRVEKQAVMEASIEHTINEGGHSFRVEGYFKQQSAGSKRV